jgi:hypothetical protein
MKKILLICAVVLGFAFTASAQDNQKAEFKFNEENTTLVKYHKARRLQPFLNLQTLVKSHLYLPK